MARGRVPLAVSNQLDTLWHLYTYKHCIDHMHIYSIEHHVVQVTISNVIHIINGMNVTADTDLKLGLQTGWVEC